MEKEKQRICFLIGSALLIISALEALTVTPNLVWIPEMFAVFSIVLVIYGSFGVKLDNG